MKLIDGSKIVDSYRIDRLAERFNPAADRSDQVAMRIVFGNILLSWHCQPPE
jgi:hypothetical protein